MVKTRKSLIGAVFGRLTVLEQAEDAVSPCGQHCACWLVQCSCGSAPFVTRQANLSSKNTTSCGCYNKEVITKHGMEGSPTYRTWNQMIQRCTNINNTNYHRYGGRGISVCHSWLNSFEAFYEDMGERPEGMSIDRIDHNGDYEPLNCRWAGRTEQTYNQNKREDNTAGRTGVYFDKALCKWKAAIQKHKKQFHLGYYDSFEDAVIAREKAELELYGYTKE